MDGMLLLLLLVYSGFAVNLVLQCALGIKGIVESKTPFNLFTLIKLSLIFFTIILLWFFFSRILYSVVPGVLIYVLLFPVSVMVYDGLEFLVFRYVLKKDAQGESVISFPGGITAVAVFICINMANGIPEAAVLAFGFSSGIFFVNLIVMEIRRRAALEAVPFFLRGKPLVLVAMGLLSLAFTTASLLFFRMIGAE
jgi:electron transport complex protein RnfA